MRAVKRLALVAVILVATGLTAAVPAGAAAPRTRWVDDDGHAGPNGCGGSATAATHIQAAIDASHANDTVIVCSGIYVEQVTIDGDRDGLTLRSSKPFAATIKTPSTLDSPLGFTYLLLVDHVDDVMVRGFKMIVRTHAPCSIVQGTVVVAGSQDVSIRGNRIMAPGSTTGSCFQYDGIIAAESGQLGSPDARATSVLIGFNEVRDATDIAIGAFGLTRQVKVDIVHNSIRAYFGQPPAGTSTQAAGLLGSPGAGDYGIGLFGPTRGSIRNNVIQGASSGPVDGPYFYAGIGIQPDNMGTGPYVNGPIDIRDNIIRRTLYGIYLPSADQLTVRRNRVTNNYVGIDVPNVLGGSFRHNIVSGRDLGIQLDASSTGNTLIGNTVSGGGGNCTDASSGTGTAGTANTWTGNTATQGSTPTGICPEP